MDDELNPYTPELELPIRRDLEMVLARELPEAVYHAGDGGWMSALGYWARKGLSVMPIRSSSSLPLYYLDFLCLAAEEYVTQWEHIHPSHEKLVEEAEEGHFTPAPFFVSGDGKKETSRLSKKVWKTPLYRQQLEKENISKQQLFELSAFALSLALGRKLHDQSEGGDRLVAPFPSCRSRLDQIAEKTARETFQQVLAEAQGARDRTANELLEYITRRLGVRWEMDHQTFHFTPFLWSDEGEAIIDELSQRFMSEPLYRCLLGSVRARADDSKDLCRNAFERQLSRILWELAEGRGILRVEHKVQAINSLDKQVQNILATFEEVSAHQWEFLTRAKRTLIEKQYANEAIQMIDGRIRSLEFAIASFEDAVESLGLNRLDKIPLIKELQESCDRQQRAEVAERAMMDFIRLHPNYEWRTHAEVLQEQIADDLDTLIVYCLGHIPEQLSPERQRSLEARLHSAKRNLGSWTQVGCDPRSCQVRLVEVFNELQDSIAEEAPSLYTQRHSEVLAGLRLVGSLLETVTAFFPVDVAKA